MSSDEDTPSTIPFAPLVDLTEYELEEFVAVDEASSDAETTRSDLVLLNNNLAICNAVLPQVRTIAGLCALSTAVCKLIETRRKVKKLAFGAESGKGGRTFEVLE